MPGTRRLISATAVVVTLTAAVVAFLLAGRGEGSADSPLPCPGSGAAGAQAVAADPLATPPPPTVSETFCNATGRAVNALHLVVFTSGYLPQGSVSSNAPGCPSPSLVGSGSIIVDVSWPEPCVDPDESVTVVVGGCEPTCGPPHVLCYNWEASGLPSPSPCDICPTGEPSGGQICDFATGDINCDNNDDSVDALAILRHVAGLDVSQEPTCPEIGSGADLAFGDLDCDGTVESVDALRLLRFVAYLPNPLFEGCRAIGWR